MKIHKTGYMCELHPFSYLGYCGCGCGRQLGPHDRVHDVEKLSNGARLYVRVDCWVRR